MFKNIIKKIIRFLSLVFFIPLKGLVDVFYFRKKVAVVHIDGGLCSQMYQYALGKVFENEGYKVFYECKCFKKGINRDLVTGKERLFELKECFPYLDVNESDALLQLVFSLYYKDKTSVKNIYDIIRLNKNKLYLNLYYEVPHDFYKTIFKEVFKIDSSILNAENQKFYNRLINENNTCGIHVRRGDLADKKIAVNSGYGIPCTLDYYVNAVSNMYNDHHVKNYYIFSDDSEWVIENLIPRLSSLPVNVSVVSNPESDKGYTDFILLSSCKNFIVSLGSFGKFAALLTKEKNPFVALVTPYDAELFINSILFNYEGKLISQK